jgi:hypothetical protein
MGREREEEQLQIHLLIEVDKVSCNHRLAFQRETGKGEEIILRSGEITKKPGNFLHYVMYCFQTKNRQRLKP